MTPDESLQYLESLRRGRLCLSTPAGVATPLAGDEMDRCREAIGVLAGVVQAQRQADAAKQDAAQRATEQRVADQLEAKTTKPRAVSQERAG